MVRRRNPVKHGLPFFYSILSLSNSLEARRYFDGVIEVLNEVKSIVLLRVSHFSLSIAGVDVLHNRTFNSLAVHP